MNAITGPSAAESDNAAAAARSAALYAKVGKWITPMEWPALAPLYEEIAELKRARGAVVLAHNYMTPDIFHGVGDFQGDSLALAREAARSPARVIVQAGVHFMAETSKILCPDKMVLIPDLAAGCSLAESISAEDVRAMRARHPGVPVVTYVNTSAAVKAESDMCCTSANAVQAVEAAAARAGTDTVILIPDQWLAGNVAAETDVRILTWAGACEVHERFTVADIDALRTAHPDALVFAHPECPPDVVAAADMSGSTGAMAETITRLRPAKAALITECAMADNLAALSPQTEFVRPCHMCPHMKRITLVGLRDALRDLRHEVRVDPDVAARARLAIEAMLALPPAPPRRFAPGRTVPAHFGFA